MGEELRVTVKEKRNKDGVRDGVRDEHKINKVDFTASFNSSSICSFQVGDSNETTSEMWNISGAKRMRQGEIKKRIIGSISSG